MQWLNPQIIATVDSLERVHVIDVRSMEELEVHIVRKCYKMKYYCKVAALEITINCNYHCDNHSLSEICSSAVHIILIHVLFLSRVKMNSTNWPVPNVLVFIAQLVEHCSTNA